MLNAAQVHLSLNHFPVAGIIFSILFIFVGRFFKMKELLFSGMVLVILSGLAIIPMDLSGDGVEEIVKHKPGVTRALIHEHEEMADKAIIIFEVSALLAIGWFVARKKKPEWMGKIELATLGCALISAIVIANTAHLGGMIRHEEIRDGAVIVTE